MNNTPVNYIPNATPAFYSLNTQDLSIPLQPRNPISIPQHLPLFYFYGKKGSTNKQLVSGSDLVNIYGSDTFDVNKPYYNHATKFIQIANAAGNAIVAKRVIPTDAGPPANINLYLDIMSTQVPLYQRNADGTYLLDVSGNPVPEMSTGSTPVPLTVQGYIGKWVVDYSSTVTDFNSKWGELTNGIGSMTSGSATSIKWPILQLQVPYQGSDGNNNGFTILVPNIGNTPNMPVDLLTETRVYPYFISMVYKSSSTSSPTTVQTALGDQYLEIVFKPKTVDPVTTQRLYIGDILINSYQNTVDSLYPEIYGNFGNVHIYQSNIDTLLAQFLSAEIAAGVPSWNSDFYYPPVNGQPSVTPVSDKYLFNFLTGTTSTSQNYLTFQLLNSLDVNGTGAITFSSLTTLFANGGSDGTMSDSNFAALVSSEMLGYGDPNSILQDDVLNPETFFYDSGFPLQTKYDLCNFIAKKPNTFLWLCTNQHGQPTLDIDGELSLGTSLNSHVTMFTESAYFGTPTVRAGISVFDMNLINDPYTDRVPVLLQILQNSANFMGSSDGKWKGNYAFDTAPNSVVTLGYNFNVTGISSNVANALWASGLTWIQPYDERSYFFPDLRTVYPNDASVLTGYFTACAICTLAKVAKSTWRQFTGSQNLTNAQLIDRVTNYILTQVSNLFDGRFIIKVNVTITSYDALRGYSWTVIIGLYAPENKTVMIEYVQAFRIDDLVSTNNTPTTTSTTSTIA